MRFFRCPTCGEARDVRVDKKGKFYLICDDCGVQLFIRRKKGIERMNALIEIAGNESQSEPEISGDHLFED